MIRNDRATEVASRLAVEFKAPKCALDHTNSFELLVAVILSAQCTDVRVNVVTEDLFKKYKRPEDYLAVPVEELEADIRPTGFFRNKAKSLRGMSVMVLDEFGGVVPNSMAEMIELPGVGRKTANVVLHEIWGIESGIAVDTHVRRLSGLLGLSKQTDPGKIECDLMMLVPQEGWGDFSHRLILHGRKTCKARWPACGECVLSDICPSAFMIGPKAS